MAVWDDVIPPADLKMFDKAGMGTLNGFGERPALLIVDVSNSYSDPRYPMAVVDGPGMLRAIRRLLDLARARHIPVLYTTNRTWRFPSDRGRWKSSGDPILSTPEASQIADAIAPLPEEQVLIKLRASAFFGTELASILTFHRVDTLIVTGAVTSGCVRASVVDAHSYNYLVIIPEEAVGDRGIVSHKVSLFDMHMKYGDVLPVEDVARYLESLPTRPAAPAGGR